ncbi:hypothetical protein PRZ48_009369 [Zasmidium cellare]|uniref:Uncharacterized protein n=1 Tax=Zasmidium cellare TaxID=395010 RepID=A0ABR0EBJ4_ZASCE|nr:hypothetical protein PRZ48_009369 [Zasmidium cellare]
MNVALPKQIAAVKPGLVVGKAANGATTSAVVCEELIDAMDIIVEWDISVHVSAHLYPSPKQRQCRASTSIKPPKEPSTAPSIQEDYPEQPTSPQAHNTPRAAIMSGWQSWPGSRGAWQGRPRGYYGQGDDSFIGRRGAMENNWSPFARTDMTSPADYARDYYGGSWSGRAGQNRHAAMQQQFMGLQPGSQYNSRLPRGFF